MNYQENSAHVAMRPNPDVLGQRIGDTMLLINLQTDRMYELNYTATRLWELLNEGFNPSQIQQRLAEEFDADSSSIADEVSHLLSLLIKEALIHE